LHTAKVDIVVEVVAGTVYNVCSVPVVVIFSCPKT